MNDRVLLGAAIIANGIMALTSILFIAYGPGRDPILLAWAHVVLMVALWWAVVRVAHRRENDSDPIIDDASIRDSGRI